MRLYAQRLSFGVLAVMVLFSLPLDAADCAFDTCIWV